MNPGEHAVCVAINDNDRAWYEMLVPFILSLRQGDYRGHIAVIGFGLSQRKIDILRGQHVNVVLAEEPSLPVGRYLEVARICDLNPGLRKIALYDADIWFPSETFDLFSLVEGPDIHVCKDAYLCDFVTDPLIGPLRQVHTQMVRDEVVHLYGSALQAGLIAGTSQAWQDFAAHVHDCQNRVGTDFRVTYGLDTTFLHLWGAKERVKLLPATQNYVTKFGVKEGRDAQCRVVLSSDSGPIRGLHMTTDIRYLNSWRFYSIHGGHALRAGQPFALAESLVAPLKAVPAPIEGAATAMGFEILSIDGEEGAQWHAFRDGDGFSIVAAGNHEIRFRTTRRFETLALTVMYLSGHPAPIRARIVIAGQELVISKDLSQSASLTAPHGTEMFLHSESLPGQTCKIVWILSERHAVLQ